VAQARFHMTGGAQPNRYRLGVLLGDGIDSEIGT
jgi:hypothetical protein